MKTIKVIDLYNKMAKEEKVPRKFTYKGYLWEYDVKNKMWFYYFGESKSHRFDRLFYMNMILNDTVEILEEKNKIPNKWEEPAIKEMKSSKSFEELVPYIETIMRTQNDVLDYLKSKGE